MKNLWNTFSPENLLRFTVTVIPGAFVWFGYFSDDLVIKQFLLQMVILGLMVNFLGPNLKNRKLIGKDAITLSLLIFFAWLMVSIPFALDPLRALTGSPNRYDGFSTLLIYGLLFLSARTIQKVPSSWNGWLLIGSALLSTYGIAQSFGLDFFPAAMRFGQAPQVIATFGNPNFFGIYLVLMAPIAFGNYLEGKSKSSLFVYGLILYALLATRTMGAWIGVVASIGFYFLIQKVWLKSALSKKRILVLVTVSLAIILAFNLRNLGAFTQDVKRLSQDITDVAKEGKNAEKAGSFRIFIWSRVVEMIEERPIFGFGIENMGIAFEERYGADMKGISSTQTTFDHAHNEYLHYAVTSGIPSLLSYLALIFFTLRQALLTVRKDPSRLIFLTAVIGYLIQAFFASSVLFVAFVFWVFLGLIVPYNPD